MANTTRVRAAAACLAAAAALTLALPATPLASFHLAEIDEVLVGYGGDAGVQFVEIEMLSGGQNLVAGSKLAAFDASGSFLSVVLTVGSNVASGAGRRWIMATSGFETVSGLAADFLFAGGLPADGMVCWGKPVNQQTPSSYVDCVSYGAFTGAGNVHTASPNPLSPVGRSLRRVSDGNDSATDFVCAATADPENNAGETVALPATSPCSGATTTTTSVTTTTGTTTSTLASAVCGDGTGDGDVTASDALRALSASVGSSECALCLCDVDQSGSVAASDALRILSAAVGAPVVLDCIPC